MCYNYYGDDMRNFTLIIFAFILIMSFCGCGLENISETTQSHSDNTTDNLATGDSETFFSEPPAEPLTEEKTEDSMSTGNSDRVIYGSKTDSELTFTGLEPLPTREFTFSDIDKWKNSDRTPISHSYGVASDEAAHFISVDNRKFFDENGFDAICLGKESEEKKLYLTFDCGYENGYTSKILDVLKEKNVTAAFFCTLPQMKENPELIARMINDGHIVGNHSVTHPDFSSLSETKIAQELKGFDDYIREKFGYSAMYFRYPEGKYSEYAMNAVNSLGYKCVFWSLAYADWDVNNQKGAEYAYDTVMSRIHPGAVILLHSVSSDNANALSDIIDGARDKGYTFVSLEDD